MSHRLHLLFNVFATSSTPPAHHLFLHTPPFVGRFAYVIRALLYRYLRVLFVSYFVFLAYYRDIASWTADEDDFH